MRSPLIVAIWGNIIGGKSFPNRQKYRRKAKFIILGTMKQQWWCPVCERTFKTDQSFLSHLRYPRNINCSDHYWRNPSTHPVGQYSPIEKERELSAEAAVDCDEPMGEAQSMPVDGSAPGLVTLHGCNIFHGGRHNLAQGIRCG